ncbi:MAG: hypothetical protein M1832_003116 [Thelocarpon impressellum]|nr:MAG: hypothetical protein M1832_003116 [Thelocarpon impressellum]
MNTPLCSLRAAHRALHSSCALQKHPLLHHSSIIYSIRRHESSTALRINHNPRVNGPVTTLPAPLVLHERAKDESLLVFAYKRGKNYLSFYETGAKNVWNNYKLSRTLQATIASQAHSSLPQAVSSGLISRSDLQLLHRSAHDIKRVPLFAVIVLVFGEWTPVIAVFMSAIVPWPCRTPQQILNDRTKVEDRRRASFRNLSTPPPKDATDIRALSRDQIQHIGRSLHFYPAWTEPLASILLPLIRRRLGRHTAYLTLDDALMERDGGPEQMEMEEVRMALVERGLDTLGRSDAQLRSLLRAWLAARKRAPLLNLFLTRPSVWQERSQKTEEK